MAQWYRREALAQFFTRPGAHDNPTEEERMLAGDRLIDAVYAAVRERFPEHEAAINTCTLDRFPLGALWRHPVLGVPTRQLMVEMGLLYPLPPHIAQAFRAEDDPNGP